MYQDPNAEEIMRHTSFNENSLILSVNDDICEGNTSDINENIHHSRKFNSIAFSLSNARSLASKLKSLIDQTYELDLHFSMITETWFTTNKKIAEELSEVENGQNVGFICKNRKGKRGGGVAISYNKSKMQLKKYTIPGNEFEMVCAVGNSTEDTRKFAIFSIYIPPDQKKNKTEKLMDCLSDCIETVSYTHLTLPTIYSV